LIGHGNEAIKAPLLDRGAGTTIGQKKNRTTTIDPSDGSGLLFVDPYNDFLSEGGKLWPMVQKIAQAEHLGHRVRHNIHYNLCEYFSASRLNIELFCYTPLRSC
jgi:hypothetical protein